MLLILKCRFDRLQMSLNHPFDVDRLIQALGGILMGPVESQPSLKRCDVASCCQQHGFAQRSATAQIRACERIEAHRHGLASTDR